MTKEKILKLTKYINDHKQRLQAAVPEKHKNRIETYKAYLKREIEIVEKQLELAKLGLGDKK